MQLTNQELLFINGGRFSLRVGFMTGGNCIRNLFNLINNIYSLFKRKWENHFLFSFNNYFLSNYSDQSIILWVIT